MTRFHFNASGEVVISNATIEEVEHQLSLEEAIDLRNRLDKYIELRSQDPSHQRIVCECDQHGDARCRSTAYAVVIRNGKRLRVCDRCDFTTDVRVGYVGEPP